MATWPIFDVCARETGFEVRGEIQMPWWRQKTAEDQLSITVEAIQVAVRVWRRQESGRRDRSEGGSEGGSIGS